MKFTKTDVKALAVRNVEYVMMKKLCKVDGGSSRSLEENFSDLHSEKCMRVAYPQKWIELRPL
jgi:hypothetical protein